MDPRYVTRGINAGETRRSRGFNTGVEQQCKGRTEPRIHASIDQERETGK